MGASTAVLIVVSPANIVMNILLIHHTSLGILGSPLALSLTYWLCFGLLGLWTSFSSVHKQNATWDGFQPSAVFHPRSCYLFLKLAVPGILMVGTEWFVDSLSCTLHSSFSWRRAAFEIVALAAGRLGALPLAAQSVIMTTDQSICFAFSIHGAKY
jgi:MATE family multidrug resistance protein